MKMDSTYSIFCEQGEYQIMMCKIYLSFKQLTSVNTPPPAPFGWRQTRSFRPAGLEENLRDRMSQTHCIRRSLRNINKDGRTDGVRRLLNVWQKVINKLRDYTEGTEMLYPC